MISTTTGSSTAGACCCCYQTHHSPAIIIFTLIMSILVHFHSCGSGPVCHQTPNHMSTVSHESEGPPDPRCAGSSPSPTLDIQPPLWLAVWYSFPAGQVHTIGHLKVGQWMMKMTILRKVLKLIKGQQSVNHFNLKKCNIDWIVASFHHTTNWSVRTFQLGNLFPRNLST